MNKGWRCCDMVKPEERQVTAVLEVWGRSKSLGWDRVYFEATSSTTVLNASVRQYGCTCVVGDVLSQQWSQLCLLLCETGGRRAIIKKTPHLFLYQNLKLWLEVVNLAPLILWNVVKDLTVSPPQHHPALNFGSFPLVLWGHPLLLPPPQPLSVPCCRAWGRGWASPTPLHPAAPLQLGGVAAGRGWTRPQPP